MAPRDRERRSGNPKSSVKQPPKKSGAGGKYTFGKVGEEGGSYDYEERRIDPEDGFAYTWDELSEYYKGKYKKKELEAYWEYDCKPARRAKSGEKQSKAQPKAKAKAEPKAKVKAKAEPKAKAKVKAAAKKVDDDTLAKSIAEVIPYFPFKKLDKFYDIQGLLHHPKLLNAMCAVMARRFRKMKVSKICGFEARGFLFTPVAIKLGVPFVMLRKAGKMPNTISSGPYTKEYEGVDEICVQKGAILKDDKVVLIDDLVATGGTLCAGIKLMQACEAAVVECACMVELKALNGREKCLKAGAESVWGFISEDLLTTKAELPDDYKDDGKK
ncbi:Adenine phosphoribosyltransferase (APRT) [Durusdinium trenchii]|uniref:adenine phosphoribosyltransferase n=1 Tax=Durusdinium trenchii TaxID=1381693 RepID=A0ABP0SSA2_9DINO